MADEATVPISGRVRQEDYEFLMAYPMGGKVTASEKLRGVLSFFRTYHENLRRYGDCVAELERLAERPLKSVREAERQLGMHSDVVDRATQALPRLLAEILTADIPPGPEPQRQALRQLEARLADGLVTLLEAYLRLALTRSAPAYDPRVARAKLGTAIELIDLIRKTSKTEGTSHE